MDSHNNHSFVAEDIGYDDLIDTSSWPASANQQYNFPQSTQDQYTAYPGQLSQPSYENYGVSQQASYTPLSYTNSPYASQYQRPTDVFVTSQYSVDSSLQVPPSNYQAHSSSFSFAPQSNENATISPQSLQYNMGQVQTSNNSSLTPAFQRSASASAAATATASATVTATAAATASATVNGALNSFKHRPQDQPAIYFGNGRGVSIPQTTSAQYQNSFKPALASDLGTAPSHEHDSRSFLGIYDEKNTATFALSPPLRLTPQEQQGPQPNQLRITRPELYEAKNSSSRPRFEHAPFIAWEDTPIKLTISKNSLPKYHPRKSRSGKDPIPGFNVSESLTPAQISNKRRGRGRPRKDLTGLSSNYKGTSQGHRPINSRLNNISDDGGVKTPTSTESSSSETESSSEEESEYEDEEIPLVDIREIRGDIRPTNISQAARWDAIGIIWKDPNSNPNADLIKDAIEKFANFVGGLRVQIKAKSTQIDSVAAQPAELVRLQGERRVLLESLYQAITAANELGYGPIVDNLGGHHKLVNGLTTTLIECIKADDFLGPLPKAVFTLLAKFKTLTDELLKKLKFDSIQKRWNKKGDEDTKKLIGIILANTVDAKERASKMKKDTDDKSLRDKVDEARTRASESFDININPAKRPYDGDAANGKPKKKPSSEIPGNLKTIAKSLIPKRSTNNLLGISTKPAVRAAPKKREPSPSESKLGALLASIAKEPEPPKTPDAPLRAPETPEEKSRRERKESRRHLRVKFKEGSELEEVRLFKHEQSEDEGRQHEMLRDAHDDRLEGMMHKKRVSEDTMDDDEDYQPSEAELPYSEPSEINFSLLEKSSRFGPSFVTRGGELAIISNELRKQQKREGLELMVVYTDPSEIPPSPKEPSQVEDTEITHCDPQLKGPVEPWLVQRYQEISHYGPERASQLFLSRREEQMSREIRENRAHGVVQPFSQPNVSPGIASVLQQLGTSPAPAVTIDPAAYANIIAWVNHLAGKSYPPSEPPEWMSPEAKVGWWEGYNRDMAAKHSGSQMHHQVPESQVSMMATAYQQPILPTQAAPFPPSISQSMYTNSVATPDVTQQVQSYLAAYQNGSKNAQALPNLDYSAWAAQNPNLQHETQAYAGQNQAPRWDSDWEKEHSNATLDASEKVDHSALFDESGEYKGKKKPCRFFHEGKCTKGPKCTYLHTAE